MLKLITIPYTEKKNSHQLTYVMMISIGFENLLPKNSENEERGTNPRIATTNANNIVEDDATLSTSQDLQHVQGNSNSLTLEEVASDECLPAQGGTKSKRSRFTYTKPTF